MEERQHGPGRGESRVRTDMNINPGEEGMHAPGFADQEFNRTDEIRGVDDRARSPLGAIRARADEIAGDARTRVAEQFGTVRDRIAEPSRQAADRVKMVTEKTNDATRGMAGRYPLAVVAIPFLAGLAIAGKATKTTGMRARVRLQIRGAAMAALTGFAVKQGKDLLGLESGDAGVSRVFGDEPRRRRSRQTGTQM